MRTVFLDPLYGPVCPTDFERRLLFSPEVQRLRYVRLCNINSLLLTGASEPKRFEHIVGVLRLAQAWALNNTHSNDDYDHVVGSAILHDVQTPPFGHSLQYIMEDNRSALEFEFSHEDIESGKANIYHQPTEILQTFCTRPFEAHVIAEKQWGNIQRTIKGEGKYSGLICSDVDIDNIDNVIRLAFHMGLAERADAQLALEVIPKIGIGDGGFFSVQSSEVRFFERWLQIRADLYRYLLQNWAEFSAKAMLTRSMEIALYEGLLGVDDWLRTDDEIMHFLAFDDKIKSVPDAVDLARNVILGALLEPLLIVSVADSAVYQQVASLARKRDIEKRLCDELFRSKKRENKFIIHPIMDNGKTKRRIHLFIDDEDKVTPLGDNSNSVLLGVFGTPDDLQDVRKRLTITEIKTLLSTILNACIESEVAEPITTFPAEGTEPGLQLGLF